MRTGHLHCFLFLAKDKIQMGQEVCTDYSESWWKSMEVFHKRTAALTVSLVLNLKILICQTPILKPCRTEKRNPKSGSKPNPETLLQQVLGDVSIKTTAALTVWLLP